ncbi:hypothetical protein CR513_19144, partial [Mucuna pruriens]
MNLTYEHESFLFSIKGFKMRKNSHNFLALRKSQQNGVIERKNRSIQEMNRTMLNDNYIPNTSRLKLLYIRLIMKKAPYELWIGKNPNISYFHIFGCEYFIMNTKNHLGNLILN